MRGRAGCRRLDDLLDAEQRELDREEPGEQAHIRRSRGGRDSPTPEDSRQTEQKKPCQQGDRDSSESGLGQQREVRVSADALDLLRGGAESKLISKEVAGLRPEQAQPNERERFPWTAHRRR